MSDDRAELGDGGIEQDELPRIRFVDRFMNGDDVIYAQTRESGVRLFRVTGETEIARSIMVQDAVIHDGSIVRPSYEPRYRTIDLHHHQAGRQASIRADKILDEPVTTLEVVPRV